MRTDITFQLSDRASEHLHIIAEEYLQRIADQIERQVRIASGIDR
jgi:hypothetical protein